MMMENLPPPAVPKDNVPTTSGNGGSSGSGNKEEEEESFPHVLNEALLDAMGNSGIYTGSIMHKTNLPHQKGRIMYVDTGNTNGTNTNGVASYVGDWNNGYWDGPYGVCTLQNGDVYKGPFVKHERHGLIGDYHWKETFVRAKTNNNTTNNNNSTSEVVQKKVRYYQGSFHRNQRQGHGKYVWKTIDTTTNQVISTSTYVGMFDNGLRQGHGIYTSPNKLTYSGEWYQGNYHGYGVLETIKSETTSYVYKGYFVKGKKEGQGSEVAVVKKRKKKVDGSDDGDGIETSTLVRHEGLWKQDKPVEEGAPKQNSSTSANGNSNGTTSLSSGTATPVAVNKTNLSGHNHSSSSAASTSASSPPPPSSSSPSVPSTTVFSTFQPIRDASGSSGNYRGIVQDGLPQGVGTMKYCYSVDIGIEEEEEGSNQPYHHYLKSYEGFWQSGIRHGFGRCLYDNGDNYVGQFEQNVRQGRGEYTTVDGKFSYKGPFREDKPHGSGVTVMYEVLAQQSKKNNKKKQKEKYIFLGTFENGNRRSGRLELLDDTGSGDGYYYQGEFNSVGVYHGTGEFVTSSTTYKGEFQNGQYHGVGTLKNTETNKILVDKGNWDFGQLVDSNLLDPDSNNDMEAAAEFQNHAVELPEPPAELDWDNLFASIEEGNFFSKLADSSLTASFNSSGGGGGGGNGQYLPDSFLSSRSLGGGGGGGADTSQSATTSSSSIFASAYEFFGAKSTATTTTAANSGAPASPKNNNDECSPVVDLAVWDGQDNPGRYTGLLHVASQRPHGVGRMVYNDGNRIHEGFWHHGHRQGHGRCLFVHIGDYHEGDYHANLRHGPGKYYWKDGRQYIGMYHNDERHGIDGKFIYPNGDVYTGDFEKGQRSGVGTFSFNKKTCSYTGEWKTGVYHGKGRLQWKTPKGDDQEYIGEFAHGLFHGNGEERVAGQMIRKGFYAKGRMVTQEVVAPPAPRSAPIQTLSVPSTAVVIDDDEDLEDNDDNDRTNNDDGTDNDGTNNDDDSHTGEGEDGTSKNNDGGDDNDADGGDNNGGSSSHNDEHHDDVIVEIDLARERQGERQSFENGFRRRSGESTGSVPSRATSTASTLECPTSTEQSFEAQREQWRASLDPENN